MEIIKSNTKRSQERQRIEIRSLLRCCLFTAKRVAKSVNTVIHEKQKPMGLYVVNVDFPLPFVMDAYLFKKTIFLKQIHRGCFLVVSKQMYITKISFSYSLTFLILHVMHL
jgi:hypothetical protein